MKKNWLIIGTSILVLTGLVGCTSQESSKEHMEATSPSPAPKEDQASVPTFSVEGLKDGDQVKPGDVKLSISLAEFELVNFKDHQEAENGRGHIHIWLDTDPSNPKEALKVVTEPNNIVLKDVKAGEHTLVIGLVGNDHKPIEGSETKTFKFTAE
ncbi:hypothetical protein [Ammoniphilus sp. 3BR4]|uniref:hypothetical protein n=1 Tax=Ammoniphilus sp. 3BR4 TaxID=3158265 RepID=UPI003467C8A4